MEAAFSQKVSRQEVSYLAQENHPSARTALLLSNAKADWLWHNHKKMRSLPPLGHMHKNDHFTILLTFFHVTISSWA